MKQGRKPKSALQHELDGTSVRRPVSSTRDAWGTDAPTMPERIGDDPVAAEAWEQLLAMAPQGLLTEVDVALLSVFAQSHSLAARALADIETNGMVNNKGAKNPSVSVFKSANDMILKCLDRMGLAPADRERISIPQKPLQSKFAGLIGQRKTSA